MIFKGYIITKSSANTQWLLQRWNIVSIVTIAPFHHNKTLRLLYQMNSPLWCRLSDIPIVRIPLSASICIPSDDSSHAALVLRAATASHSCVQLLCASFPTVLSSLLPFAPSTGCICSEHAQCNFPMRCSGEVTDTGSHGDRLRL